MTLHIHAVSGSSRRDSRCRAMIEVAAAAAREAGATVSVMDLAEIALPLFRDGDDSQQADAAVQRVRQAAHEADGFLLATPEYHGGISSAMKNWFDHLHLELAGKLAGLLAVASSGGGDMSVTATRNSMHWCHGFTLPFHVIGRTADFDADGRVITAKVLDRLARIGHDVVRYTPVLRAAFESARELGDSPAAGFAGYHQ
ncbi:MAG: NADPH-dependent FMN reductase [Planctomycetota bacterium]